MAHAPEFSASARTANGVIAEAGYRTVGGAPLRLPAMFSVLQDGPKRSPVRVSGRPALARSSWKIDPAGALGYLHGRSPFASFAVRDFRMRFGRG